MRTLNIFMALLAFFTLGIAIGATWGNRPPSIGEFALVGVMCLYYGAATLRGYHDGY